MKRKIGGIFWASVLTMAALSGWFFTLLVDIPMLMVLGYAVTFFVYRVLVPKYKWLGVYLVFLIPVNIVALWIGGILPYFNLMEPEAVYFHIIPKKYLGETGNDFMWNGLLLPIVGRVLPVSVLPTNQHFLFNVYALLIWLSYPFALVWSSLRAFSHTVVRQKNAHWYKIFFPELLKMIVFSAVIYAILCGLALLIAKIYQLI